MNSFQGLALIFSRRFEINLINFSLLLLINFSLLNIIY